VTEAEWLTCDDSVPMIDFLYGNVSDRKLRLFGCACCRRIWHIYDEAARHAVEVAEQHADGTATKAECRAVERAVKYAGPRVVIDGSAYRAAAHGSRDTAGEHADVQVPHPRYPWAESDYDAYRREYLGAFERERLSNILLLRDIFGNPFRPVAFDPAWRTDTAVALAAQMYESRDFSVMPILADALQDAGCDNDDILAHCRGDGPHVRGCWVVDLVLGKS